MGFFEKIGEKAAGAYKITAEKTSQVSKEIKCKMKMESLRLDLSKTYEEIGQKVYNVYKEEEVNVRRMIKLECEKADQLLEEIEEVKIGNLDGDITSVTSKETITKKEVEE